MAWYFSVELNMRKLNKSFVATRTKISFSCSVNNRIGRNSRMHFMHLQMRQPGCFLFSFFCRLVGESKKKTNNEAFTNMAKDVLLSYHEHAHRKPFSLLMSLYDSFCNQFNHQILYVQHECCIAFFRFGVCIVCAFWAGRTYMYNAKTNAVNVSETNSCNMLPFSKRFYLLPFPLFPFFDRSFRHLQHFWVPVVRSVALLFDIREPGRFVCLTLKVSEKHTYTCTHRSSNEFNQETGFTM